MVTATETRIEVEEQVGVRTPTLEELGVELGIPIKMRPWWGSRRARNEQVHTVCGTEVYDVWDIQRRIVAPYCPKCNSFLKPSNVAIRHVSHTWICPRVAYPMVEDDAVVFWAGECGLGGHNHGQSIEVVDTSESGLVVGIRAGITGRNFLVAKDDGHPFATALPRKIKTVQDAFDWLVPKFVRDAYILGKDVKRQGDWFFVPSDVDPVNQYRSDSDIRVVGSDPELWFNGLYEHVHLIYSGVQTRHVGEQVVYRSLLGASYGAPRVKGEVVAPDHPPMNLESWHIGVRRRSAPGTNGDSRSNPGFD